MMISAPTSAAATVVFCGSRPTTCQTNCRARSSITFWPAGRLRVWPSILSVKSWAVRFQKPTEQRSAAGFSPLRGGTPHTSMALVKARDSRTAGGGGGPLGAAGGGGGGKLGGGGVLGAV